jgi:hypothetical protein
MATKLADADVRLPIDFSDNCYVEATQTIADRLRVALAQLSGISAERIAVEIVVDPPEKGAAPCGRRLLN